MEIKIPVLKINGNKLTETMKNIQMFKKDSSKVYEYIYKDNKGTVYLNPAFETYMDYYNNRIIIFTYDNKVFHINENNLINLWNTFKINRVEEIFTHTGFTLREFIDEPDPTKYTEANFMSVIPARIISVDMYEIYPLSLSHRDNKALLVHGDDNWFCVYHYLSRHGLFGGLLTVNNVHGINLKRNTNEDLCNE